MTQFDVPQADIIQSQKHIKNSWNVVKKLKDDTVAMINHAVKGLPDDSNGIELSKSVLQHMATLTENPYDLTIELIKKDIHNLF